MAIEGAGYRTWSEGLNSPWRACWSIARTGLMLVLRKKLFWLLLGVTLLNFIFVFALIYLKAQVIASNPGFAPFLDRVMESMRVSGSGDTYRDFIFLQGTVTMLLLAFAGEMLIGSDYRQGGLTFYLSRRIGVVHYVIGKLLTIGLLVSMITTLPALVLFFEYGLLTDWWTYFSENWRILVGILGYGLVISITLSLLLFALASWLQRTVPLVMSWACLFIFVPLMGGILSEVYDDRRWMLLMIWRDIRIVGSWFFGSISERDTDLLPWATAVVVLVCLASIAALIPKVRAVQVVR